MSHIFKTKIAGHDDMMKEDSHTADHMVYFYSYPIHVSVHPEQLINEQAGQRLYRTIMGPPSSSPMLRIGKWSTDHDPMIQMIQMFHCCSAQRSWSQLWSSGSRPPVGSVRAGARSLTCRGSDTTQLPPLLPARTPVLLFST